MNNSNLIEAYKAAKITEAHLRTMVRQSCSVMELLRAGLKVDAIMKHRENTGNKISVVESKAFIENLKVS